MHTNKFYRVFLQEATSSDVSACFESEAEKLKKASLFGVQRKANKGVKQLGGLGMSVPLSSLMGYKGKYP